MVKIPNAGEQRTIPRRENRCIRVMNPTTYKLFWKSAGASTCRALRSQRTDTLLRPFKRCPAMLLFPAWAEVRLEFASVGLASVIPDPPTIQAAASQPIIYLVTLCLAVIIRYFEISITSSQGIFPPHDIVCSSTIAVHLIVSVASLLCQYGT